MKRTSEYITCQQCGSYNHVTIVKCCLCNAAVTEKPWQRAQYDSYSTRFLGVAKAQAQGAGD